MYVPNAENHHEPDIARIRFAHGCEHPNRFGVYFPALEVGCHESNTWEVKIPSRDEVETLAALTVSSSSIVADPSISRAPVLVRKTADGGSRARVLHALKTWPNAGLAPRVNLVFFQNTTKISEFLPL